MSILKEINDILKTLGRNRASRMWFVIMLIVVLIGGYGWLRHSKEKPGECDYFIEQNRQLVNSLLEIRLGVNEAIEKPVSYYETARDYFIFATYIDTVPTQQQKLLKVLAKIDSVLIKRRLDSLKRVKTKG